MIQITNITDDFYQQQTVNFTAGPIVFYMKFYPQQNLWFMEQISYNGFTYQGIRISTSLNFLRQFKNSFKIGMACLTSDNFDPTQQQDFSSGYANLYVLDAADVASVEAYINGS